MTRMWTLVALLAAAGAAYAPAEPSRLRTPRAATPPRIDGRIEPVEWQSAEPVTLKSRDARTRCVVYALNDDKRMYWAFSALDDATHNTGRASTGVFDNIAVWFAGEVGYWLYGNGELRTEVLDAKSQKSSPFPSAAGGAAVGPPRTSWMMYELEVPLGEIGIAAGESIAVGLHYWDDYDRGPSFWWPAGVDVFTPRSYGTLVTSPKR